MQYFFLLLLLPAFTFAQDLKKLDAYIAKAQKEWNIPGLSVGIVKDGKLIFEKGYGVKEQGKAETVDSHTLYAIASNTKAFTSAAIARLAGEGKLGWDDAVTDHLPWFRLYDPWVTSHITIRDLLCHRVGFRTFSGDLLWNSTTYSRREIVERARFLKPTYDFRAGYGYSNIMFITAGEVIQAVTGQSWEQYISEQFLDPLGMTETVLSVRDLEGKKNVAAPHTEENGVQKAIAWENWDNMGPAGSVISSVHDLSGWLTMQLSGGTLNNHKYFDKDQQRTFWEAHTSLAVSEKSEHDFPSTHYKAAALGWFTFDYKGVKVVNHGGGYIGMVSKVAMVPEKNLGIVILTNAMEGITTPLTYRILDEMLGGEQKDWCGDALARSMERKQKSIKEAEAFRKAKTEGTTPSLPLEKYTGRFGGDLYGDADIKLENGKLQIQLIPTPAFHATLEHYHFDTFTIRFPDFPYLPEGTLTFILNAEGKADELRIFIPNGDFWFEELEFMRRTTEITKEP